MRIIRLLAIIFTLLGMLGFGGGFAPLISSSFQGDNIIVACMLLTYAIMSFITGLVALITLITKRKSVFVGIMAMLFNGFLGGLFYLIYTPSRR